MKSPVFLAIPAFFILMAIEAIYAYRKGKKVYRLNDTVANISLGIGNQVVGALAKGLLLLVFMYVYQHYAFFKLPVTWWSFVLCLLLFDFLFYWAHRLSHESNLFWGAHVVHHQSEEYNLSVALRQPWFHDFISFFIFLPVPLLGFDPKTFVIAAGVQTLYQFWIHTRVIGRMPAVIEYFFNSPSHHRVHHAVNPQYIDKNHAGVFMVWDRMFGTFKEEEEQEEITYGITNQFKSWNPVWANMHYYKEMWESARRMKTRDKVRVIFARPGWLPDYLGGFQQVKEVNKDTYTKYNEDTSPLLRAYGAVQFVITLAGTVSYLDHYHSISVFYRVLFAAVLILSILIVGAIFERRAWIAKAEILRLLLVLFSLNSFYYYWYNNWFAIVEVISAILFIASIAWLIISMYKEGDTHVA
jgi:sterol desaturase/sphingolipid hydroxylase (fatty acid hydroxylase superfamily)